MRRANVRRAVLHDADVREHAAVTQAEALHVLEPHPGVHHSHGGTARLGLVVAQGGVMPVVCRRLRAHNSVNTVPDSNFDVLGSESCRGVS